MSQSTRRSSSSSSSAHTHADMEQGEPAGMIDALLVLGIPPEASNDAQLACSPSQRTMRALGQPSLHAGAQSSFEHITGRFEAEVLVQYPLNPSTLSHSQLPVHLSSIIQFAFPQQVTPRLVEKTPSMSSIGKVVHGMGHLHGETPSFVFQLQAGAHGTQPVYGVCVYVDEVVHQPSPSLAKMAEAAVNHSSALQSQPQLLQRLDACRYAADGSARGTANDSTATRRAKSNSMSESMREQLTKSRHVAVAPRAYCILTRYPFFRLHLDVLNNMIGLDRLVRVEHSLRDPELTGELASPASSMQSPRQSLYTQSQREHRDGASNERNKQQQRQEENSQDQTVDNDAIEKGSRLASETPTCDGICTNRHSKTSDNSVTVEHEGYAADSNDSDEGYTSAPEDHHDIREEQSRLQSAPAHPEECEAESVASVTSDDPDERGSNSSAPTSTSTATDRPWNHNTRRKIIGELQKSSEGVEGKNEVHSPEVEVRNGSSPAFEQAVGSEGKHPKDADIEVRQGESGQRASGSSTSFSQSATSNSAPTASRSRSQRSKSTGQYTTEDTAAATTTTTKESVVEWQNRRGELSQAIALAASEEDVAEKIVQSSDALKCAAAYAQTKPPVPGRQKTFQPIEALRQITFRRPKGDSSFGSGDDSCEWAVAALCRSLSLDTVATYIQCALLERQVAVVCPNIELMSAIVMALPQLLKPLQWQSLLLPVLPENLQTVLEAPVPYVVGVLRKTNEIAALLKHTIRLNVSKDRMRTPRDLPNLPGKHDLMQKLKPHHRRMQELSVKHGPLLMQADGELGLEARSFLNALHEWLANSLIGNLQLHSITDVSQPGKRVAVLYSDSYVESFASSNGKAFAKQFIQTQMFSAHCDYMLSS